MQSFVFFFHENFFPYKQDPDYTCSRSLQHVADLFSFLIKKTLSSLCRALVFFFFHGNFFSYNQDLVCLFKVIATRGRPFFFFYKKNFVFSMHSFGFFFSREFFSHRKKVPAVPIVAMLLSNCWISPHHFISLNSRTFFSPPFLLRQSRFSFPLFLFLNPSIFCFPSIFYVFPFFICLIFCGLIFGIV